MSEKIRVMHFTYSLDKGGAERQLVYLLNAIDPGLFQNAVCCIDAQGQEHIQQPIEIYEEAKLYHWDLRWGKMREIIAKWKPELVHVWMPYVLASAMPALLHSSVRAVISSYRSTYLLNSAIHVVQASCLLFVQKIVSNVQMEDMHFPFRQLFRLKAGEVIPNGFDLNRILAAAEIDLKPFGVDLERPRILYIGRLIPDKNVNGLLRALSIVNRENPARCQLILCGEGSQLEYLQGCVRSLGIEEYVFFLGYRRDVYGIMKNCDALVLPSFREGMPNVLFEGMADGMLVIASDIPTHRRWIEDGSNGFLFDPSNPEQLAECIRKVIKLDTGAKQKITENARSLVSEYTVDRMVEKYEDLYQRMATGAIE